MVIVGDMDELTPNGPLGTQPPTCAELSAMAERELSAFFKAVTELFGSAQAETSANDWIHELVARDSTPCSVREWRELTAAAAAQLASRVSRQTRA